MYFLCDIVYQNKINVVIQMNTFLMDLSYNIHMPHDADFFLSIYVYVYLSIYLCICLFSYLSIYLDDDEEIFDILSYNIHMLHDADFFLDIYVYVYLSIYLCICLLSIFLSLYLSR